MSDAATIAADVRAGRTSAVTVVRDALARIERHGTVLNAVTRTLPERALDRARAVDAIVAAGRDPGPLAGVPFAVKDLFDVVGLPTTAGARARADAAPAKHDAPAIARLSAAGAVLVATTNMDEYAYGFSTENGWHGTTRNPHDPARLAGGSSGGSAAVVAAGLVPIALGSDTNGSIRVPASLCGIYGLRPTFGDVPVAGAFPFVERLDTVGAFARTPLDLRLAHEAMRGAAFPPADAAQSAARLDGWFRRNVDPRILAAVDLIATALGADAAADLRLAEAARSAGFVLTAAEGGHRHLPALRRDAMAFDPGTRDRLIAGALQPAAAVRDAEVIAERFVEELLSALDDHELLIAPATPCAAPMIAETMVVLDGRAVSARANLGLHAQPLSLAGVPCLSVPVLPHGGTMPVGVQLIGRRGGEARLLAAAGMLAAAGIADAPVARHFTEVR